METFEAVTREEPTSSKRDFSLVACRQLRLIAYIRAQRRAIANMYISYRNQNRRRPHPTRGSSRYRADRPRASHRSRAIGDLRKNARRRRLRHEAPRLKSQRYLNLFSSPPLLSPPLPHHLSPTYLSPKPSQPSKS